MIATVRTHDNFYLKEDRSQSPKEYFKFLVELTKTRLKHTGVPPTDIADIGCASGDFLHYLRSCFPTASLHGIDILDSLLSAAKLKVPEMICHQRDMGAINFQPPAQYDLVYMAGVHSAFDSSTDWTKNIASMMKDKATAYVFGMFNPLPYDVLVNVRKAGDSGPYELGWNSPSKETVSAAFKEHGCKVEFVAWNIPIDLAPHPEDGLRAWTIPLADGKRLITNATRIIHDFHCAIITRV